MAIRSGVVEKIIFKNEETGFFIFSISDGKSKSVAKGFTDSLVEGDFVECEGVVERYKGEDVLKATSILKKIPMTEKALISFLSSGRIPGVGKITAQKLVEHLGLNLFQKVQDKPNSIELIPGFSKKRAETITTGISDFFVGHTIDVFLERLEFKPATRTKIKKAYGRDVVKVIEENPYRLVHDVDGVSFLAVDAISKTIGIDQSDPRRISSAINYTIDLEINRLGSTMVFEPDLIESTVSILFGRTRQKSEHCEEVGRVLTMLVQNKQIVKRMVEGFPYCYPYKLYLAENGVAENLIRLNMSTPLSIVGEREISSTERRMGIELADSQKNAIVKSVSKNVSIITGGPGTGKTTILKSLIDIFMKEDGIEPESVLLCSPTGKAAQRLSDSCALPAKTIHRALEYNPETNSFNYDSYNKLPHRLIVIDESSMMDVYVTYWLVQAIRTGARIIIVGDVDQLPSVGPGQVLKDLIDSGAFAVSRLTEIFRQAATSSIIVNAHRVNNNEMPIINHKKENNDFWFIERDSDQKISDEILSIVNRMSEHYSLSAVNDFQVLSPMKKGITGVFELNNRMQEKFNKTKYIKANMKQGDYEFSFMENDKIIQIKNNNDAGVFNGNIGIIDKISSNKELFKLSFGEFNIDYTVSDMSDVMLAYAMTIHKSQGSEYPVVVIPMTLSHSLMLNKNLLYTALTRAKAHVVIIGSKRAMKVAVDTMSTSVRNTGLVSLIKEKL